MGMVDSDTVVVLHDSQNERETELVQTIQANDGNDPAPYLEATLF